MSTATAREHPAPSIWQLRWNSIRVRLTLWNMSVVAMVMVGFSLALSYTVRTSLSVAVDADLADRMNAFRRRWSRTEPFPMSVDPNRPGPWRWIFPPPDPDPQFRAAPPMFQQPGPQPGAQPVIGQQGDPRRVRVQILRAPGPGAPDERQRGSNHGGPDDADRDLGGPGGRPGGWGGPEGGGPEGGGPDHHPDGGHGPGGAGGPGGEILPQGTPEPKNSGGRQQSGGREADRRGFFRAPKVFNQEGLPMFQLSSDEAWDPETLKLSLAGLEHYSTVSWEGEPIRVFSAPLWRQGNVEGAIQVAHPLTESNRLNAGLSRTLTFLIPLALLVAGVGGVFLSDRALRPVRKITQTAAEIEAHDLSRRLDVSGQDELSELAGTFNGMIGRLEEAFGHLERAYEQQRRFTGDAFHELRTPLTTIKANTSLMLFGEHSPEEYREALMAADEAADGMNRIIQDLLLLARSDSGQLSVELKPHPLRTVLEKAVAPFATRGGAAVTLELPDEEPPNEQLAVLCDPLHLGRLIVNLIENAHRHTPSAEDGGGIIVRARADGAAATVQVQDNGEGIPPEHLPHVCERFYRVDAARSRAHGGTGLGLAICQSIVQAHHGAMTLESELGKGTRVTVTLPRTG